jgi:hypothetical protein
MTDDSITDNQTRGDASQEGFANYDDRRNPDQPTAKREDAGETTTTQVTDGPREDLLDRTDDHVARDSSDSPIEPHRAS